MTTGIKTADQLVEKFSIPEVTRLTAELEAERKTSSELRRLLHEEVQKVERLRDMITEEEGRATDAECALGSLMHDLKARGLLPLPPLQSPK